MSHQPTSQSNQSPSRGSAIFLWIGFVLFLVTALLGVFAIVLKQNIVISIITLLLALLSIPIGILQIDPQFRLIALARQTIVIGLRIIGITLLIVSLSLNVYLFLNFYSSSPPLHQKKGVTPAPTALSPTIPIRTITPSPSPPPKLVQKAFQSGSDTMDMQMTFGLHVTLGNLIVLATTQWEGSVTKVTDTQGNTYTQVPAAPHANSSNDYVQIYYAKNVVGGLTTVKVHFSYVANSSASNDMNMGIYEYNGLNSMNPVDQVVSMTGNTSAPDGGTLHTTKGSELYFVMGVDDNGNNISPIAGSGYKLEDQQDDSNNERYYMEDRIVGPGSSETNFSLATSSAWAVIGVSFT